MKGLFFISLLITSSVAFAQQSGPKSLSVDSVDILSDRYLSLQDNDFLKLKIPEIRLDDNFYTILEAPIVDNRYEKGSLLIKQPEFIPEMPISPTDALDGFYLLNLDPVVVTAKDE